MTGRKLIRVLLIASAAAGVACLVRRLWTCSDCHSDEELYLGNPDSEVFHRPGCRLFTVADDSPEFRRRDEAVVAGYRPCGVCKP